MNMYWEEIQAWIRTLTNNIHYAIRKAVVIETKLMSQLVHYSYALYVLLAPHGKSARLFYLVVTRQLQKHHADVVVVD